MKLVELTADDDGLIHLGVGASDTGLFQTFIDYCLIHFIIFINWKCKAYATLVLDIFTESDEM